MQAEELVYGAYLDGRFSRMWHVRAFGPWEIVAASEGDAPVLLVVNDESHCVTVRRYDSPDERELDLFRLSRLPPGGGDGAGMFARLSPVPPTLSPGEARPWPVPGDDQDQSAI